VAKRSLTSRLFRLAIALAEALLIVDRLGRQTASAMLDRERLITRAGS